MSITSKSIDDSFSHLCRLLETNRKVYFGRYGDGEIYTMLGADCLEHTGSSELAADLREAFFIDDPLYLRAVGVNYPVEKGMVHGLFAPYTDNFQLEKDLLGTLHVFDDTVFENQILFHYLAVFRPEMMNDFLNRYIRGKKIMFIGGTPREVVEKIFGPVAFYIPVPTKNAYYSMKDWFADAMVHAHEAEVIIPSAGVTSKIILGRLWKMGVEAHCLDIGSLIDAVHGKSSRKWIKLMGHRINRIVLPVYRDRSLAFRLYALRKEIFFVLRRLYRGRFYKVPYHYTKSKNVFCV